MKSIVLLITLLLMSQVNVEAQIWDKVKKESLEKAEDAFDKKTKKKKSKEVETPVEGEEVKEAKDATEKSKGDADQKDKEVIKLWTDHYDFQPGKEIIFFDDYEDEEDGEIPSKWEYNSGMLEITETEGKYGKVMSGDMLSSPNFKEGYQLPEKFTVDFDVYLIDPSRSTHGVYRYALVLNNSKGHDLAHLWVTYGKLDLKNYVSGTVPGLDREDFYDSWHHIAISINGNSIKAYFDQYRLINARLKDDENIAGISFKNCCLPATNPHIFLLDNFRITEGGHEKYKEEIIDGKIVTNNILFETNSADLLSRSYAEIKRIANIMEENPDISFSVEGHTDHDGSDDYNMRLSEKRAAAVAVALKSMGIDESRLEIKGYGESIPLTSNDTSEGKAMNRRVEFVVL